MCPAGTICTLTLAFVAPAQQGIPAATVAQADASPSASYGGRLFLTDAAVFAVSGLVGAAGQPAAGAVLASAGYVFDGAIVHGLVHGKALRALASVGLRLGTPFAAGLAGAAVSPCGKPSNDFGSCPGKFGGAAVGMVAGAGIALLIDDLFLARD